MIIYVLNIIYFEQYFQLCYEKLLSDKYNQIAVSMNWYVIGKHTQKCRDAKTTIFFLKQQKKNNTYEIMINMQTTIYLI